MKYFFEGYSRDDGTAGTRNYVGIVSSVICSGSVVQEISDKVQGAIPFVHSNGCSQIGDDLELTKNMLVGVASNPNINSALLVGLGCETNQVNGLLKSIPKTKPIRGIGIQQLAGSDNTVQKGVSIAGKWMETASKQQRVPFSAQSLTVGILNIDLDSDAITEVGPTMGAVVDKLIDQDVKVVMGLSRTLEPAGAELAKRLGNSTEREKIIEASKGLQRRQWDKTENGSISFNEFTEEQKNLAMQETKITGTKEIKSILSYGELPVGKGLHLVKVSEDLVESLSKLASSGCNIVLIVSNRGVLTGSNVLPCLTITPENDGKAFSELVDYQITSDTKESNVEKIIEKMLAVCSGEKTKLEELELGEFSIPHLGTTF